jgi:hypothetical protein
VAAALARLAGQQGYAVCVNYLHDREATKDAKITKVGIEIMRILPVLRAFGVNDYGPFSLLAPT